MPSKRRKKAPSKRMQSALAAHAKFLASHGINAAQRPTPTGASAMTLSEAYTRPTSHIPSTSDTVPAHGTVKTRPASTGGRVIGQAYNKGPLMVLSDKSELANSKRRDR
jgi:hypothetical protein